MNSMSVWNTAILFSMLLPASTASLAHAGDPPASDATPGFNHRMPPEILTPDEAETSIGTMRFFDGMPDEATVDSVYDNLHRMRAVEAFLDFIPAASIEAIRRGMMEVGIDGCNKVLLFGDLMDSNSLFLTGNTDTVYAIGVLDVGKDGPIVVEIPPGAGPGTVNDAFFRFVIDMGAPGPDRGKGGKYLIVPESYEGEIPEGYFVARTPSMINVLPLRGLLKDGKTDAAREMWTKGLRIYPLSQADAPPPMEFIPGTGRIFNTIHANDATFYEEIDEVIQREPIDFIDPELRGNLAAIGIEKGQTFAPDERMRRILDDAAKIGNATARALSFRSRSETASIYPGSVWFSAFDGEDHRWLIDDGNGGRNKDARTRFFYVATVNTPAMVLKLLGAGSQYALAATDSSGAYLDGSDTYRLTIPADPPAKDFWSIVVYDPQTRSMLQTGQPYPSKNSQRNRDMVSNADGSITLWFAPEAPAGHESNWIQTVPGKAWFAILRLYGPLEPWFDKTWRPGEIEKVD
ncbi:MAG: DUF1254 domain-containing protein [Planctomycetota bacterium]|jgi:hypothetical protein|nr:DUF1254 domain-containing protein [Planctomycetota bacterium]